ncbi:hypothetical protein [Caldalkalibacillus mannanilyticus]|uniref:hypothetical protein n=1 Tax=Caldalkalibacillus mannanilyticus TaxID=1418 RepID=UPI0004687242|nr:hypothetical protein [Caldalkalibacillus mannanilyticus]
MLSSEILDGIENIAHDRDSSVIVCHTASNGERTMKYLQMLHEKRVDGLIFASSILTEAYYQRMVDMNVPVVLLSTASSHPFPFVKVDDEIAAYSATEYLIQKGHRHIAMVSGSSNDHCWDSKN